MIPICLEDFHLVIELPEYLADTDVCPGFHGGRVEHIPGFEDYHPIILVHTAGVSTLLIELNLADENGYFHESRLTLDFGHLFILPIDLSMIRISSAGFDSVCRLDCWEILAVTKNLTLWPPPLTMVDPYPGLVSHDYCFPTIAGSITRATSGSFCPYATWLKEKLKNAII